MLQVICYRLGQTLLIFLRGSLLSRPISMITWLSAIASTLLRHLSLKAFVHVFMRLHSFSLNSICLNVVMIFEKLSMIKIFYFRYDL